MDWESDEEEDFQPLPHPALNFEFKEKAAYQLDLLVIATYGVASLFAQSLIGEGKPINRLNFARAKQQSLADLYQVDEVHYLVFNDELPAMKEAHFAQFMQKSLEFKRAIVLTSKSRNTLNNTTIPNLTYVSTSSFEENSGLKQFREGLTEVPAEVLQMGQLSGRPVCCYVGTVKEYEVSSGVVEEAFGCLRGKHGLSGKFDITDKIKKFNMKKNANKLYL